jgi:subtilisin-like proprotein convertase family protein
MKRKYRLKVAVSEKINTFKTKFRTELTKTFTPNQTLLMRKIYFLFLTVFSFLATTQNSLGQYCTVTFPGNVEPITLVNFNTINNSTSATVNGTPALEDFTAITANVFKTVSYPITVKGNTDGNFTTRVDVYIDWNQDNDFDDAGEIFFIGTIINSTGIDAVQATGNILVPATALEGNTRMRVMKKFSTSATPCNSTGFGQAEDYTITISPLPPCIAPPGGGTAQGSSGSACSGSNFTITVTGGSFGTGLTYQWESSPNNATWSDISGATSATLTTTQTASTYYRRKITCSLQDAYSTSLLVTSVPAVTAFPWTEGFNATTIPACWSNEYVSGTNDWTYVTTNGNSSITPRTGARMAEFRVGGYGSTTRLVTPRLDITSLTVPRVVFYYANVNWDGDIDELRVYYKNSAGGGWTQIGIDYTAEKTAWTEVALTLPAPSNDYYIAFQATSQFGYGLNLDDVTVEQTPPCLPPSGLGASPLTTTSETINWTASATASNGYQWEIRTSGAGGSGATGLATSGNTAAGITTANATGLTANTSYNLYVRSNCGSSIFSTWAVPFSFTTLCGATNVPYTQNFDAASTPNYPSCLTLQDLNGATTWKMWYSGGVRTSSSPNSIFYERNASMPANDWFFIQGLNLTGGKTYTLSFKYKGSDGLDFIEKLEVKYGTAPNASAMTSGTLFTNTNITSSVTSPFAEPSVTFAPAVTGIYYVGFHAISDAGQGFLYIDDIEVQSCPKPTNVTAIGISTTSALVSFTSAGSSFVVEYGAPGFVPGTTAAAGGGTVVLSAASPVLISGLTVNTAYDFYVRSICIPGVEYSSNVEATASTLCPATSVPYLQNFDGVTSPTIPTCNSVQDINGNSGVLTTGGNGGSWETFAGGSPIWYVSPNNALAYIADFVNTTRIADDWYYLQGLNLTAGTSYRLKFHYTGSDGNFGYIEKLEIKYGTAAFNGAMTNLLYSNINITSALSNLWDSTIVDFTPTITGVYYIGFHAISDANQAGLLLDDISVKTTPGVDVGITGIVTPALTCPTNGVIVQGTMRNYNLTAIDFSVNPITVTANITGTATAALTATINSGTLAAGASMDFYLNPAFDFAAGTYNIVVATSSPDDPETANNSYITLIKVNPTPVVPVITPSASQLCIGSTVQLSTQFTNPPPPPVNHPAVSSGAISLAIPDNSPPGVSHTLSVSGIPVNATITGVSVTINATHTWNSDLIFNLKAPNGNVLNLVNRKGGSGVGFTDAIISSASSNPLPTANTTPVTGTFAANAASAVGPTGYVSNVTTFTGLYSIGNGNWTLAVRDAALFDEGTLTSWSITITYQVLNPVVTWSPVAGLFTNAAATTAYTGGDAYSVYAKPDATTTYTATATGPGGCTSTGTATVTVNPYPVITIGAIPDTVCISDQLVPLEATPVGGSWSGTGVSGTNFVPPVTAVGTYTLTYRYTNDFGCTSTATKKISVKDCPERIILLRDNAVILYPNPNNGQFSIRINSVLYNYLDMKVFTNDGVLVRTQQFGGLAYGRVIPIDLTNLPGGVYMVKFYYDGGARTSEKTFKVIIAH